MNKLSSLKKLRTASAAVKAATKQDSNMVMLKTTINKSGEVSKHGPFEKSFLEKWVAHSVEQNGDRVLTYEILPA